jgi:hypothetical protein
MINSNAPFTDVRSGVVQQMKELDAEVRKLRGERVICEQFLQACNRLFPIAPKTPEICRVCGIEREGDVLDEWGVCQDCLDTWQDTALSSMLKGERFVQVYDFGDGKGNVPAHKHSNGGGWVANTATVEDSVIVEGDAMVSGYTVICGHAVVIAS